MTETTICTVCGGYIGNTTLFVTLTTTSTSPIVFCPGHFPIMCTGVGPELIYLPKDAQIFPNDEVKRQNELWQIVQEVVEIDSTCDGEEDVQGIPLYHFCPYCGNEQKHADRKEGKEFPHAPACIVTKARVLMQQRKAQPQIEVKIEKPMVCALCGKHYESADSGWCGQHANRTHSRAHMKQWLMKDALPLGEEVTLEDLRTGALFVTHNGCYAVKSEYLYPSGMCECVLLESGEYAHFKDGNRTLVREVKVVTASPLGIAAHGK